MTPTQKKTYDFIVEYKNKYGVVPSTNAIANKFKVTNASVQQVLNALFDKKYIKRLKYVPHGNYEVIHSTSTQG